ncbi:unnamed protein product [Adineta steineri]|nr:unnamed protein product [Adineta steineri]
MTKRPKLSELLKKYYFVKNILQIFIAVTHDYLLENNYVLFSSTKPPYQSKLKNEPENITNEKYINEKINKLYEKYDGKLKELTEIETAKPKCSHRIENQLDDNSADGFAELVQELGVDPADVLHVKKNTATATVRALLKLMYPNPPSYFRLRNLGEKTIQLIMDSDVNGQRGDYHRRGEGDSGGNYNN